MANTALPLSTRISQDIELKVNRKVRTAQLGDGYISTTPYGRNPEFLTATIKWEYLTYTEFYTIKAAITTIGYDGYFTWTLPNESTARKWAYVDLTYTYPSTYVSVTMQLREVFV